MTLLAITGARVLTKGGWAETDVLLDGGRVAHLGPSSAPAPVVDGTGMYLGPGFVDLHTHLRDPGQTHKEDIATGTAAAARGGFTAVVAMPNTDPPIDDGPSLVRLQQAASASAVVDVLPAGALSRGRLGEEMALLDDLYEGGVRIFTDDGDALADGGLLRRIMEYTSDRGDVVIAQHAEDRSIAAGGHLHHGWVSQKTGVVGIPAEAETAVIARDLELAAATGARYHVQHLSTGRGVELVRQAKALGLPVTAEVTPHHLALTMDDAAGLDPEYKMYPPLRTAEDRDALVGALVEGVIDAVATDHAPHTALEKDLPFEEAPRGVIGLETAFPVVLAALSGDLELLFERMSVAPAAIAGVTGHGMAVEVGAPANLVLVDPGRKWTVEGLASRSSNTPFLGEKLEGMVMATIVGGEIVYGDGR